MSTDVVTRLRNVSAQNLPLHRLCQDAADLIGNVRSRALAAEAKIASQSQEIARLTERCDAYKEALAHKDENIAILVGLASRWDFLPGDTDRDDVRKSALYQRGDTVQIWANEGDIWLLKHFGAALAQAKTT